MLYFIAGRKNSNKTAMAHEVLGRCVKKGENAMLIVPKQYTFESDKSILSLLGPRLACEVEVLSFSRLAHVAVKNYGGITKPFAKQGVRSIFMALAIKSLEDKLTVFSKHKNEMALVNKMLSALDEMKLSGITYTELEEAAERVEDNILKEKLFETALIFRTYEAVVSAEHFDDEDLLLRVCDILKETDFFEGKTIVIDGFREFTYPERRLISLMLERGKDVYITLCTCDPAEISELSAFAAVNHTYRRLRCLAEKSGTEYKTIMAKGRRENVSSEELNYLEENLYSPYFIPFEGETKDIEILSALNINEECDAVARRIKEALRSEKYRARDIAVVYRKDEKYEKGIRRSLKKYEVEIFEDKRQPVDNQPLVTLIKNLILIVSSRFDSEYIFRYLKTGLLPFTQQEISTVENYTFTWDICGTKWLSEWTGNPDGFGVKMNARREKALAEINALREKIIAPILALSERLKNLTGKEAVTCLYEFLRENSLDESLKVYAISLEKDGLGDLAIEQEQVWDILMESFDEIACALGDTPVEVSRLGEIFSLVISSKSLGKLPDGFDEVYICTADRILTKNAKVLFAVGMNSGVFPLSGGSEGLFPQREKRKLAECGVDLFADEDNFVWKERFFLYSTLAAAKEKLYLSYSNFSPIGEKLTESEAIGRIKRLFPKISEKDTSEDDVSLLLQSEQAAFELMAQRWEDKDGTVETLKHYFASREDYSERYESLKRAVQKENFSFRDKNKSVELFGENMRFSATRLETFSKCPFMYFCKYGLYLKPRVMAKLDPALGGTVVHHVLEMILKKYPDKAFTDLSDDALMKEIDVYLFGYMDDFMGGKKEVNDRFYYLFSRMRKILLQLFQRLRGEFINSDFEPCDFELSLGEDERVSPFTVELERGKAEIIGYVDRVDKMDLEGKRYIRIVDYKTGGKDFTLSDVFCGMNMQMLLYLMSIWRTGKGFYENTIPAGVLYFPAKMTAFTSDRNASEDSRQAQIFQKGKMTGMLVGDDNAIYHMDKSKEFLFLPVKYDAKNDRLKGNFISVEQLKRLGGIIDGTIKKMGDSLHEGKIPASPLFSSGHTDTCVYCDYFEVCLKDKPDYRFMKKLSHDDCLRRLEGGEENGEKLD